MPGCKARFCSLERFAAWVPNHFVCEVLAHIAARGWLRRLHSSLSVLTDVCVRFIKIQRCSCRTCRSMLRPSLPVPALVAHLRSTHRCDQSLAAIKACADPAPPLHPLGPLEAKGSARQPLD